MSHSILAGVSATDRVIAAVLVALAMSVAMPAPARAQWGQVGTPVGQQAATPAWGQYGGTVGGNGWQYNQSQAPSTGKGATLNPNQISSGAPTVTRQLRRR